MHECISHCSHAVAAYECDAMRHLLLMTLMSYQLTDLITLPLVHSRLKTCLESISQILPHPSVVSLLPPGLRRHGLLPGPFLLGFCFIFSLFFRFWAVRKIKLVISSAFERTLIYLSYRIVSLVGLCVSDLCSYKMVKTGQFTTKCKGNKVIGLKQQISFC